MTNLDKINLFYLMACNSKFQAKRGYLTDRKNEIIEINYLLKKNQIKPILIKGASLLYNLYSQTLDQRGAGDLDILVSALDGRKAYDTLLKNGYSVGYDDMKRRERLEILMEEEFQHFPALYSKSLLVEIHHRLDPRFMKEKLNVARIIETATLQNGPLGEQWIPNIYCDFIILCHHIYRHEVYEHMYDVIRYIDIFKYILSGKIDFNLLKQELVHHTIQYSIAYTLYCANYLYKIIYKEELISSKILDIFSPKNFEKEKDAIRCRGLFEDITYGYWSVPYEDRFFLCRAEIMQHVSVAVYFYLHEKKWSDLFEKYKIQPLSRNSGDWYI